MHSVASFFVSRVDSEVDKRLDELGNDDLKGKAAIANAQAAYQSFKGIFYGDRFAELRDAGAFVQRPLWASTGREGPQLLRDQVRGRPGGARHREHDADGHAAGGRGEGRDRGRHRRPGPVARRSSALADAGIDMGDVTKKLLNDGIEKFVEPFDQLIAGVESSKEAAVTGRPSHDRFLDPRRAGGRRWPSG